VADLDAFATMKADRAVAVIRAERIADPLELAGAVAAAGIRCVEFTFTTPGALEAIASAVDSGAVVGAGTVLDERQARDAVAAGARFVVSPAYVPELVGACREESIPVFLGALTPTEVHAAWAAGATAVKLFPAGLGGPRYLEHLRGPFPDIAFVPSGGVDERNARDYLAAGAVAVYAGSSLAPAELVAAGDHEEIARRAHAFVASLEPLLDNHAAQPVVADRARAKPAL
jgi:2-dehydro-3-deoxyphosphogluconate aldolase / (4S)-4-hydroxy-2-oxoglutarate aldolase